MKHSRFIELLNLYVDQQLTPSEAAELEDEIQRAPQRRRTYRQYCRMQKGCAVLFEQDRHHAPSSARLARALADADRKITAFPEERSVRSRGIYAAGAAAMAACVAFLFVRYNSAPSSDAAVPVGAVSVAVAPAAVPVAQPVVIPPADPATTRAAGSYYSVLGARQLASGERNTDIAAAGAPEDRQAFDWMQRVQLRPLRRISAEELAFETTPTMRATPATLSGERSTVQYENAAFQFQR